MEKSISCYNVARRTEPPRHDYPARLVKGSFNLVKQLPKLIRDTKEKF